MAAQEWRELCDAFRQYTSQLDRITSDRIGSQQTKEFTKDIARIYFRSVRPAFGPYQLEEFVEPLTAAFQALLELSEGRNLTASYRRHAKTIRRLIPRITSQLEMQAGAAVVSSSTNDQKILSTLNNLLPSAALSYQQALTDLADPKRQSFRGPAHELREALREVLDHLAPDTEMKKAGVVYEKGTNGKDRTTYTMKQKVRFIFKAREKSDKESASPENAANLVEAAIADMTRSTYDHGSLAAHKERGLQSVQQLKRYVDVIFHDLLELQ